MQYNAVTDQKEESFAQFSRRMMAFVDAAVVSQVNGQVLDSRLASTNAIIRLENWAKTLLFWSVTALYCM